jgi:hypothetical protein
MKPQIAIKAETTRAAHDKFMDTLYGNLHCPPVNYSQDVPDRHYGKNQGRNHYISGHRRIPH